MMRYFYIFTAAFVLNTLWEHAHSLLYVHYQGGEITELVLFRAAFFDASIIALFAYIFLECIKIRYGLLIMASALVLFSIGLEMWALETGRWAYTDTMPVVPPLNTGFTPIIQLGILGYLSVLISNQILERAPKNI